MDWIEGNDRSSRSESLRKRRMLNNGGALMKKRLLSVVLAFTLCFGMMPVTVLAEEKVNAETVAPTPDDQVAVRAVNSTHEGDAVGDTVSGDSVISGGVSATSL